ncbi:MAG: GtrA family protein [Bacteroidota bacterium]
MNFKSIKKLILLKAKFATASLIATAVDYILYFIFLQFGFTKTTSNFIAYPISVIVNFLLQKKYIFSMARGLRKTFVLAMLVSAGGWIMNAFLFSLFMETSFLNKYHWFAKILVTGIIFFFNFYGKRYVFEKKFF